MLGLVLLFITLEITVMSLERAVWIPEQPALTPVLVFAMAAAWALCGTRLRGGLVLLILGILGAGVTIWLGYNPVLSGGRGLFSMFLVALIWISGSAATWALLRRQNAWTGVILGAVILLVNLSNLPDLYYLFFGFYFLSAMVLVVHVRLARHAGDRPSRYPRGGWSVLVSTLVAFAVIGASLAWLVPQVRWSQLQNTLAARLMLKQGFEESSLNIFAAVPAKEPLSTVTTRSDLGFGSSWHAKDQVDYIIQSTYPAYWRVNSYDTYTTAGWTNSSDSTRLMDSGEDWNLRRTDNKSGILVYEVTPQIRTDALITAGDFISADAPYIVHTGNGEVMAVTLPRVLDADEHYTVTSAVFSPSEMDLEAAASGYPPHIAPFVELPANFPERVRSLAEDITDGAATPYEKVMAIDEYLNDYTYDLDIDGPAPGTDGVEYFLFEEKAGFCTYFASAMAVMLRAVDVPSRVAVGYLPGDPGDEPGQYILRDKYYHSWPQVWFEGYGWVDMEATPSGEGDGSSGSQVPIQNILISPNDIEQLPRWQIWYQQYPYAGASLGGSAAGVQPAEETAADRPGGPLFFADELGFALIIVALGIAALLLIFTPFLLTRSAFYRWLWHVDRSQLAAGTYLKMGRLAALTSLGPVPSQTPSEYAAVLTRAMPEQADDIDTISRAYMETAFGRAGNPNLFQEAEILKARIRVFRALLARLGPLRRLFGRHS